MYTWIPFLWLQLAPIVLSQIYLLQLDESRIVGGQPASIDEHPYQVSLRFNNRHVCGGAIISEEWIVTAAHCIQSSFVRFLSIKAGTSDLNEKGTVVYVRQVISHELYDRRSADYDIALIRNPVPNHTTFMWNPRITTIVKTIHGPQYCGYNTALVYFEQKLEKPLVYGPRVRPILLAPIADHYAAGTKALVTGWGVLRSNGLVTNQLRKVAVPLVSNAECSQLYTSRAITTRMLCAGYVNAGGKDACQGDSGGPLVQNDKLIGIVSWGYGCARPSYPGVYARVTVLRSWITEKTGL